MKLSEAAFLITHNDDVRGRQELIKADSLNHEPHMLSLVSAIIAGKPVEILTLSEAVDKFLEGMQ